MNQIKNVSQIKKVQILISFQKRFIKFNVSSTIIVLLQFQKNIQKLKKPYYLINGGFYQKSSLNKKDLKFNFSSIMFHQI